MSATRDPREPLRNRFPTTAAKWAGARGLTVLDLNNESILVRAPLPVVARKLAEAARRWSRNVLGKAIVVGCPGLFVLQLRGHAWTVVLPFGHSWLTGQGEALELSRKLAARVLTFYVSDTAGSVGYSLLDCGEEVEWLSGYASSPQQRSFRSRRRRVALRQLDLHRETDAVFRAEDALEPGIATWSLVGSDWFEADRRTVIRQPGWQIVDVRGRRRWSRPGLERVDFLRL